MTDLISYSDQIEVQLIDSMASDDAVIQAAKVSTLGDLTVAEMEEIARLGFIGFLMKNRHGSPFEHTAFKWRIKAPIFVWREFMRHRIASYNEQSGRYMVLPSEFYLPNPQRDLVQIGKPGHYEFIPGTEEQYRILIETAKEDCETFHRNYHKRLDAGICKEMARITTPVNLYSIAYVTMNSRGLMNFLSLRVKSEDSMFPSFPMWEINQAANQMEGDFSIRMPITHIKFVEFGRVQP